jgi:hypothetical protein
VSTREGRAESIAMSRKCHTDAALRERARLSIKRRPWALMLAATAIATSARILALGIPDSVSAAH